MVSDSIYLQELLKLKLTVLFEVGLPSAQQHTISLLLAVVPPVPLYRNKYKRYYMCDLIVNLLTIYYKCWKNFILHQHLSCLTLTNKPYSLAKRVTSINLHFHVIFIVKVLTINLAEFVIWPFQM